MMAVWKIAPALAAGNTVVLKPSDTTPVSTLLLAEIAAEFLPPGVLNVVCGDRDTGRAAGRRTRPRRWSRSPARPGPAWRSPPPPRPTSSAPTWSWAARRRWWSSTTPTSRRPPRRSRSAGYFNAGQDCTAATRVLAGPGVYDDFVAALAEQARGTKTGAPDDEDVLYGPLNNANQLARVSGFVDRLPDHATLRRGRRAGRRPRLLLLPDRRLRPAPGRRDHPGRGVRAGHHRAALHRRGRGGALGQRRRVRPGLLGLDPRPRPGDADDPPARLRLRLGQHATSRWSPRCRTAASSTPGYGKDLSDVRPGGLHPRSSTSCTTSRC